AKIPEEPPAPVFQIVEWLIRRAAKPCLPVEIPRIDFSFRSMLCVILEPPGLYGGNLPEPGAVNELLREDVVIPTPLLGPRCDDAFRRLHALDQPIAFFEPVCDWFFAIDVLACVYRIERHLRVPVIGRSDHHSVDILAIQQPAVVVEDLSAGLELVGQS